MSRLNLHVAAPGAKPRPHACCALAGKCLRTVSMLGAWSWRLGTPRGVTLQTYGPHGVWEAVLVVGGRRRQPGIPNMLVALPARGGGTLPGRKPIAWCAWVFDLLGMLPGDQLEDLFPGTGIVTASWEELSRRPELAATRRPEHSTGNGRRRSTPVAARAETEKKPLQGS